MDNAPSFTLCFSLEDIQQDDLSEMTESCNDIDGLSRDDFQAHRGSLLLTADPYYYHCSDGSRSSQNGNEGLDEVRMRLVRKQEEIDALSSKLSQYEVDIEALEAERAVFINELAARWSSEADDDGNGGGGPMRSANATLVAENSRLQVALDVARKSFQSHIEDGQRIRAKDRRAIGDLQRENERLRQRLGLSPTSRPAKPAILSGSMCAARPHPSESSDFTKIKPLSKGKRASLSESERTAKTCSLDASDVTLPQLGVPLSVLRSLPLSESKSERAETRPPLGSSESTEQAKDDLPSGCAQPSSRDRSELIRVLRVPDDALKNKLPAVKEAAFDEGPVKARSEDGGSAVASDSGACDLQEGFGGFIDSGEARRTNTAVQRRDGLPDEAARKNPGGLLVDFDETRRPNRAPERWQGFKRWL